MEWQVAAIRGVVTVLAMAFFVSPLVWMLIHGRQLRSLVSGNGWTLEPHADHPGDVVVKDYWPMHESKFHSREEMAILHAEIARRRSRASS